MARERILSGWQGVFRAVVLELLPVRQLAEHFSPDRGCPPKELHSMAGLVFLADFFDWNAVAAADAYRMRNDVPFALNIEPGAECSDRTVERYRQLFTEDDLAARARSRQQVAEDLLLLSERFADRTGINGRTSYTSLVKIFQQQCEVVGGRVVVIAKTGGDVIQNPSDLDATYDGHCVERTPGPGYQIQLSETCSTDNDVQLIVGAIPETAGAQDSDAVRAMLEQLAANGLIPAGMPADTAYGSDENVRLAESFGVELISPVPGRAPHVDPQALTLDDFAHHEETGAVEACPASHAPRRVTRDEATHTTVVEMSATACASCPLRKLCPIHRTKDGRLELTFTDQARRRAARRVEQATPVFRERYARRSGIESTHSGLQNRLGLGWLKVRGRGAVFRTLLLKVSGWNVLRAATSAKLRAVVRDLIAKLLKTGWSGPFGQAPRAILTHTHHSASNPTDRDRPNQRQSHVV